MARLPRYQESGLISADIPRMDFANLREASAQQQSIGEALTRISDFAFGKVQKEREQQNKLTAIGLRTDFEMESAKQLAILKSQVETGQVKDLTVLQESITALAQKQTKVLGQYSAEQAAGLANSIGGQGRALMGFAAEKLTNEYRASFDVLADDAIKDQITNLKTSIQANPSADAVSLAGLNALNTIIPIASQTTKPDNTIKKMKDGVSQAKSEVVAEYITSLEFASSATEAILKLESNNAGKYSEVWSGMDDNERQGVFDRLKKQTERRNIVLNNEFSSAEAKAAPLVRQLLTEDNPAKRNELMDKLEQLPLSPEKLKSYQGYLDGAGVFANVEDPSLVLRLSRAAEAGTLSDSELINNRSRLTKETFNSLVRTLGNPNRIMQDFGTRFDQAVGIQSANLPPSLPTAEAREAAVVARNTARLELSNYANTPVNGVLPTNEQVEKKARELLNNLSGSMASVWASAAANAKQAIEALVPELKGVDLTSDAAVEAAIKAHIAKMGKSASTTVTAAREDIQIYRNAIRRAPKPQEGSQQ
jgi:hypothetical protein